MSSRSSHTGAAAFEPALGDGHRPTIIDVARRAGVSKSVVSRVLRDAPAVSQASREAVLGSAHALGYRPNAVARSLVQRRTFNVGVLVSDLHNPFFAEVLDGLNQTANKHGFRMLISTGNRDREAEAMALDTLLELRVDAIVLAGTRIALRIVEAAAGSIPLAMVGGAVPAPNVDLIADDDVRGGELAVEHLADLGHSRIALIDGGEGSGAAERRSGYLSAMRRLDLARHILVEPGEFTEEAGYLAARRLLATSSPPTAIATGNDLAAVGALNAIEESGRRVPEDMSLVGYDDTFLASLKQISLTTVHQPRRRIGELAMAAVLRRIQQRDAPPQRQVLTPHLVRRRTTAPPADARSGRTNA